MAVLPVRLDPYQNIVNVSWRKQVWLLLEANYSLVGQNDCVQIVSPFTGHVVCGQYSWNINGDTSYSGVYTNFSDPVPPDYGYNETPAGFTIASYPADANLEAYYAWVPRYARRNEAYVGGNKYQCWINLTAINDDYPPTPGHDRVATIELRFSVGSGIPSTTLPVTVRSISSSPPRHVGGRSGGVPLAFSFDGATIQSRLYSMPAIPLGTQVINEPLSGRSLSADLTVNCRTGKFSMQLVSG